MNDHPKLGFRQKHDPRDAHYPLTKLMGTPVEIPISKAWRPGPTLDQKQTSSCVGQSCFQFQVSEPMLKPTTLGPFDIYNQARLIDEWDDNDTSDTGTSVRAGLNVLRNHGIIRNYFWAESADQAMEFLLKRGPLVFGTDWTESMFHPDAGHTIRPIGRVVGGHAWFAYAGQWEEKFITGLTSWGDSFGHNGSFRISLYDIDELFKRGGCAAAVQES